MPEKSVYRFANLPSANVKGLPKTIGQIQRDSSDTWDNQGLQGQSTETVQETSLASDMLNTLPEPSTANVLNNSEQRLIEEIARASDQGLLERRTRRKAPAKTISSQNQTEESLLQVATQEVQIVPSQIEMHNSSTTKTRHCLPSEMVALPGWSDGKGLPVCTPKENSSSQT